MSHSPRSNRSGSASARRSTSAGCRRASVLGWTVACLVHLAFGSPGTRPTIPQITDALAALGIDVHDVRFAPDAVLLSRLARDTGAAVVCSTHDPLVIEQADVQITL